MSTLHDICILLCPIAIGYPLAAAFLSDNSWISTTSLAWFLGIFLTGLVTAIGGSVGIAQILVLAAIALSLSISLGYLIRKLPNSKIATGLNQNDKAFAVPILLIVVSIITIAMSIYCAICPHDSNYDVQVVWLPKANLLEIPSNWWKLGKTTYPDYPPLWPIHLGLVHSQLFNKNLINALPGIYVLSMLGFVFHFLRSRAGLYYASLAVFFICLNPYLHSLAGLWDILAEIPTMSFVVVSCITLVQYVEHGDYRNCLLTALLGMACIFIRPEGFIHAAVLALVTGIISFGRRNIVHFATGFLIPLVGYICWRCVVYYGFRHSSTYSPDLVLLRGLFTWHHFSEVFGYAIGQISNASKMGPLIFFIAVTLVAKSANRITMILLALFTTEVMILCVLYLVLPATNNMPTNWWLETGFKRMLLHFVPILPIIACLAWASRCVNSEPSRPLNIRGQYSHYKSSMRLMFTYLFYGIFLVSSSSSDANPLSHIAVNGISSIYDTVGYGDERGWWQEGISKNAIMSAPAKNKTASIWYNLWNLGSRTSPEWISGRFDKFSTNIALVKTDAGAVKFRILADDDLLFESNAMTGKTPPQSVCVQIPLTANKLKLEVDSLGDNSSDHAVWLDPLLLPSRLPAIIGWFLVSLSAISLLSTLYPWKLDQPIDSLDRLYNGISVILLTAVVVLSFDLSIIPILRLIGS